MRKARTDRKPVDPKMLVHVPRQAGEDALHLLRQTFGAHAPEPIKALAEALSGGIARHAHVMGRKRVSRFAALTPDRPMTIETPTPADMHRIKSLAHNWSRYHGCHVATRSHPNGTAVTVYLLSRDSR